MKTELISNVSHDLKTPLAFIITYVDLLKVKNLTNENNMLLRQLKAKVFSVNISII